ncbi:hypothetical protein V491_01318 [Pseudogymnoascus sp. VKM F-3775]|nr:hypothetical protein V491_01318 [Pseudogymnoascus sp. VKM F-3775]
MSLRRSADAIHVRKDGLSEVGARKALGGKKGDETSETGSQLLSPSPSVPPGTGNSTEMEFNEEDRQMAMGMDMELDGGSMMASQQSLNAQSNWAMT